MSEPTTAAGRALWISVSGGDPSEEAPFGASARMVGAELAAIEAEARAAALDEARAAVLAIPVTMTARDEAVAAIDALREGE